jgi:hypothetical protein
MGDNSVGLDGHQSPEGRLATEFRMGVQRLFRPDGAGQPTRDTELHAQLLAVPADHRVEAAVKTGFLLRCLAGTPEGQDERVEMLIRRARGDIARLIKREERKR